MDGVIPLGCMGAMGMCPAGTESRDAGNPSVTASTQVQGTLLARTLRAEWTRVPWNIGDRLMASELESSLSEMGPFYGPALLGESPSEQRELELVAGLAERGDASAQYQLGVSYEASALDDQSNLRLAHRWYSKSAEAGYPLAQLALGRLYLDGIGIRRSAAMAAKWFALAAQTNPTAQYLLGLICLSGHLGTRREEEGIALLDRAAKAGLLAAQFQLGRVLLSRHGSGEEREHGIALLDQAARQGHAQAQIELANVYQRGDQGESDREQANFFLRLAARQGLAEARSQLGRNLLEGFADHEVPPAVKEDRENLDSIAPDDDRDDGSFVFDMVEKVSTVDAAYYAHDWYLSRRLGSDLASSMRLAAMYIYEEGVAFDAIRAATWLSRAIGKNDNPIALFCMAKLYWERSCVQADRDFALRCLKKAADAGFAPAQYALGYLFIKGEGVSRNVEAALQNLRDAASQDYARAELALGELYLRGEGVGRDYSEAEKWIRRAAARGMAEAQYNMAVLYMKGYVVPQITQKAMDWLRLAALNGNLLAQFNLGDLIADGQKGQASERRDEGLMWLTVAAERGLVEAQCKLGMRLSEKFGDELAQRKAACWLKKAAKSGSHAAQYNLALLYMRGRGVEKNRSHANYWLVKAMQAGNLKAPCKIVQLCLEGKVKASTTEVDG